MKEKERKKTKNMKENEEQLKKWKNEKMEKWKNEKMRKMKINGPSLQSAIAGSYGTTKVESSGRRPDAGSVNGLIWGIFMSATMKASVHLGLDYNKNLFITKLTDFEELTTFFDITQKLILEQKREI